MRTFRFDADVGRHITRFGSDFVLSGLFQSPDLHVGCMRLGAGGIIGLHPAESPQLLVVVQGEGWVRSEDRPRTAIGAGTAVFWSRGEMHETGTETGLVAIVIESEMLGDGPALGPIPPDRSQ